MIAGTAWWGANCGFGCGQGTPRDGVMAFRYRVYLDARCVNDASKVCATCGGVVTVGTRNPNLRVTIFLIEVVAFLNFG